jgi:hypothetical protein
MCVAHLRALLQPLRRRAGQGEQLSAAELEAEASLAGAPSGTKKLKINMSGRAPAAPTGFAYNAAAAREPFYPPPRVVDPNATDDEGSDEDDGSPPMTRDYPPPQQWGEASAMQPTQYMPPTQPAHTPAHAPALLPFTAAPALLPFTAAPRPMAPPVVAAPAPVPKPPAPKKPRVPQPSKSLSKKSSHSITTGGPPTQKDVEEIIARMAKKDKFGVFINPVTEAIAPGYFTYVTVPMDFSTMRTKAASGEYTAWDQVRRLSTRPRVQHSHQRSTSTHAPGPTPNSLRWSDTL